MYVMKKITLLFLFFLLVSPYLSANCDTAYSSATYALSHTKKALGSNNFDHQKYYADRAIEAFEKTKSLVQNCGCDESMNAILDGLENLEKAADPKDWDLGRYYTKRAYANAQELITALDICTGKNTNINYDMDVTANAKVGEGNGMVTGDSNLEEEQRRLKEEQQKLIEQQRQLEKKIEQQRMLAEQTRIKRQLELEEQLKLKKMAEQSLSEIENMIKNLAHTFGCDNTVPIINGKFSRTDEALNSESLEDTKNYYLQETISLQNKAIEALKKCSQSSK